MTGGIPYSFSQTRKKTCATFVDVIFAVGIALVNLLYLLVTITTNQLLVFVFATGPTMSMTTSSSGPEGGKIPAVSDA